MPNVAQMLPAEHSRLVAEKVNELLELVALSPHEYTDSEIICADGLVKVNDAMSFLSIGRDRLISMTENGELPYVTFDAHRRIPKRALIDFAARNLVN